MARRVESGVYEGYIMYVSIGRALGGFF